VWMPLNALLVEALRRFDRHLGPAFLVELPTGSGHLATLGEVADELSRRLVGLLLPDAGGRLPASGGRTWPDGLLWFHEYFHGDTGEGLGASHQTGWTALLAHLVLTGRRVPPSARQASSPTSVRFRTGRGQAPPPEGGPLSHSSGGGTP
jgi:hypothetical protein